MASDEALDNHHLMCIAVRFSRRARANAKAHHIRLIDCGDRKHNLAQEQPRR